MKTLYGKEAQNGDYVLVSYVRFGGTSSNAVPAFVVDGKAYTGRIVLSKLSWLRKLEAIIVIDPSFISEKEKEEINRNIEAADVKDIGVWTERMCV